MEQQKLKDAIRIISRAAKDYDDKLNGYNYIFIYKNRQNNQIEYFESAFLPRNFQHLTGIEFHPTLIPLQYNHPVFVGTTELPSPHAQSFQTGPRPGPS